MFPKLLQVRVLSAGSIFTPKCFNISHALFLSTRILLLVACTLHGSPAGTGPWVLGVARPFLSLCCLPVDAHTWRGIPVRLLGRVCWASEHFFGSSSLLICEK